MKTCIDIAEEHGFAIEYEPSGWGKICCPRHDDRSPSLRISPDGSHWKCMVCDRGGREVGLVMWLTGCSVAAAIDDVSAGEQGDPMLNYYLRQPSAHGDRTLQHVAAWAVRYSLLTPAQLDDILFSGCPETSLSMLLQSGA